MNNILLEIILDLTNSNLTNWLTLFVLTITLIAVIRYTVITDKLQKTAENQTTEVIKQTHELIKQRRLSIMPSFVHMLDIDDSMVPNSRLTIKNIGNGNAINIKIDPIEDTSGMGKGNFEFEPVNSLVANQEELLTFYYMREDKERGRISLGERITPSKLVNLKPSDDYSYDITYHFQDIEGKRYKQTNQMYKGSYHQGPVEPEE